MIASQREFAERASRCRRTTSDRDRTCVQAFFVQSLQDHQVGFLNASPEQPVVGGPKRCDLAVDFGCPLTVFAVDDDTKSAQDRAHEVQAILDEFGQAASVRTIVLQGIEDLNQAILEAAPGTLVLDRLGKTVKNVDIVSLLAQSSGSLLLRN